MLAETFQPFVSAQLGALLDTSAVGDHDRQGQAAILGTPPARNPVAATLLLGRAVGQECHQRLARQRNVSILQFGEAQVAAFGNATGGMSIDVAAQRRGRAAIAGLVIAIEILQQSIHAGFAVGIGLFLLGVQVAGQQVQRLDGRHAVALPHQPAAGTARQGIQPQIPHVGRHHV